jgi:signal transduction histidine kinase
LNWAGTQKIRLLLAVATLIPIGVLTWLGVHILAQERDVELQRERESLEIAAGRLALAVELQFRDIENQLTRGTGLRFIAAGIEASRDFPVLFQPEASRASAGHQQSLSVFSDAEIEEHQHKNLTEAATAYRRLSESRDPAIRGGGLLRLARVLRKQGDSPGALQAYDQLAELGAMPVEGDAASLIARQGRAKTFEETGASEELQREARDLARVLYAGGLPIDRITFGSYCDLLERWGAPPPPNALVARSEAASALWLLWRAGKLSAQGRRILREQGTPVLAVWEQQAVWLATPGELQALLAPLAEAQHLSVSISETDGQPIFGPMLSGQSGGLSLTPGETRLPFILTVAAQRTPPGQARTVLVSGLILAFLLMIAAAFGLYRVTTREMLLARQQSDFVSAVSHEFRTPLTSMRHLTELLVGRGIQSEERKAQYYELLANETERLHRMVEGLLSFGRIEAGAYAWQLEPADVGEMVRGIVDEFRGESAAAGREIVAEIAEGLPAASVDRDALSRALWNLLENAAKYSDPGKGIRVFARRHQDALLVGVEDEGVGIPASERDQIFHKFVRGSDAKRAGIRGVGIGLALVQRIIEAHGGSVRVESEPGRGSTFTLVIPCLES